MKFKLNEKYILAEKRHLIERYILTEADSGLKQQFQNILTEISNKYKNVIANFDKLLALKSESSKLKTLETDVQKELTKIPMSISLTRDKNEKKLRKELANLSAAANIAKGKIKSYLEAVKQYINSSGLTGEKSSSIIKNIDGTIQLANDENISAGDYNALKNSINNLKNNITTLKNNINTIINTFNNYFDFDIEPIIKTNLEKAFNALKGNIDLIKNKNENGHYPLDNTSDSDLKTIIDRLTTISENLDDTKILNIDVEQYFDDSIEALKDINNEVNLLASNKAVRRSNGNRPNWLEKMKFAGNDIEARKAVYEEYLTTVWGDLAEDIKRISVGEKNIFFAQCQHFGFYPEENPFIFFLKQNPQLLKNMDQFGYAYLNDAYVDGKITDNDLKGTGELKKSNIIFGQDLYTKSRSDFNEYLYLQKQVVDTFKKTKLANPIVASRYDQTTGTALEQFNIDIFFEPGNILAENEKHGNISNHLKLLTVIPQEIEQAFGLTIEKEPAAKDVDITEMLNALHNDKNEVIQAILYLFSTKAGDNASAVRTKLEIYPELMNTQFNPLDANLISRLYRLFSAYNITKDNIVNVLTGLADGVKLEKKAA